MKELLNVAISALDAVKQRLITLKPEDTMTELAHNIKMLRKRNKMTQSQLAQHFGKTDGAISFWETGRSAPSIVQLLMLTQILDTTIEELVGDDHVEL